MKRHLMILAMILIGGAASAQELVEKNLTGTSKSSNIVEARREILESVSQQVTEELAKQVLGEDKFNRQRPLIMGKVAKSSGAFIPFQKPGTPQPTAGGFSMTVSMKVNLPAFRQVLQQNGLLNENEAAPVLLPLVAVVDKVNLRTDRWWLLGENGGRTPLRGFSRQLEGALRGAFSRHGFYMIRPLASHLTPAVPAILRAEKPGPDDLQLLGDWFGAPLLVEGTAQISPSEGGGKSFRIDVRLSVLQVSNNRPIADVSRIYETDPGVMETVVEKKLRDVSEALANDLASQVAEAWQKGSVGSSQIRLTLQPRPSLQELEQFKEKLRSSSVGIRSIRERTVSGTSAVFEVDSPIPAKDLAARMKGFDFNGRKLDSSPVSETEIRLSFTR
ncbi:MAG: hypothetical protein KF802_01385 [Bdellovibrionaceae bacterium]|nr:hypothetical protein [Pseudobdellovibrionaceae bacterium]MBX3035035.1 hypothetical protein [Pseudobdellovibrionaceae bacterium]